MDDKEKKVETIFFTIMCSFFIGLVILGISATYGYTMGEGDPISYTTFDNELHTVIAIEYRDADEYCSGYTCYDNTYIVTVDNGEIFGTDISTLEVGVEYMMEMKVLHCESDVHKYIFRCYGVGD